MTIIETPRLILRTWENADFEPMCRINQDPEVMRYFPDVQDRVETKQFIHKVNAHFDRYGYGLYATQLKETGEFIGFIGLLNVVFSAHFTPAVEIGWRLALAHWGRGYATEGAKAVLDYAFNTLAIPEIVSFTTVENQRSRRVMEKIGLKHDPADDFDHPNLTTDSPLLRHVLYRLANPVLL